MRSLLSTAGLARISALHPWRVLAIWGAAILLAAVIGSGIGDQLATGWEFTNEPESVRGERALEERLLGGPEPVTETVIVRSETITVDDQVFQQEVQRVTDALIGLEGLVASATNYYQAQAAGVPGVEALVSADRHTTIVPVTLVGTYDELSKRADDYIEPVEQLGGNGFEVLTVGEVSIQEEYSKTAESDLQQGELLAVPVAMVVLVVVFGALVAAGVPLILALASIIVAIGLTSLIARFWELSFFVVNMITMIGLAVGIDYALFIIERFREERRLGLDRIDAITTAGGTASKAVLFSGMTVVLALVGIFLIPTTIFRSLGLGAILAVVVAVIAVLTLVPAILSLLGDRINWPRLRRVSSEETRSESGWMEVHGFWGTMTRAVMRRPVVSTVLSTGVLIALTLPVFQLERSITGVESFPEGNARKGYEILNRDFAAGLLAPARIVVDAERTPDTERAINELVELMARDPDFASVLGMRWNAANDLAEIVVPLRLSPEEPAAYDAITRLREHIIPAAFAGTDAQVLVTGRSAMNTDFITAVDEWTPYIFAFVLGLSFVLLLLAFRSIVVPLKAIIMNLLSVGAAYGLLVLVFQEGYGAELLGFEQMSSIEAWIPAFLFCVLFGLSMDYHVFLLSRVQEHFHLTHHNAESVAAGLHSTARIITGAALIMVVVFSGFATAELVMFQQMGFGLAVAILLDATIVRSVLVPASMALLGDRNWYMPSWLAWLPNLSVEGRVASPVVVPVTPTAMVEGD